eukprot:CAMPEP_0181340868 /NCGR_PEP_ID=MMETSP1101-20121128/30083_1 /TAXON_ID=46948 /ORGANISM="Rhodomonas abbreviata, Strain Caron Lab Isolate" /LENGTH=195 /DNA_ID=CAMNT_0023452061 /DNA_START=61 /DNA_END=648 /DNA_ORIENTATION=-
MSVTSFILKTVVPIGLILAAENFFLRDKFPQIYEASNTLAMLPKAFGGVLLVNVVGSAIIMLVLGFGVGAARSTFREKALKDGDKEAEARYSYPKMYAEGFTEHAKMFNCVQRGHQHAMETYSQFLALSLVAGLRFPVCVSLGGLLWMFARLKWAEGYKTGEPSQRYQHWCSYGIWSSLLLMLLGAGVTAVSVMV